MTAVILSGMLSDDADGAAAVAAAAGGSVLVQDPVEDALWLAVTRLQAYASVQQSLGRRLSAQSRLAGRFQEQAEQALRAANLITTRVLGRPPE